MSNEQVRPKTLTHIVRAIACEFDFARVGFCRADPVERADYVRSWLKAGRHGEMAYLAKNVDLRLDPAALLPGARSVVVVAMNYHQPSPPDMSADAARGRIARYAWGRDYHRVLKKRLHRFCDRLRDAIDEPFEARACVDTAPVLEREMAARAGVGWIGKNTLAMHADIGSYFFLGVVITTLPLVPDAPAVDHCGTCTACLDACPTDAFPAPYEMDATRCISYLTIEHRSAIDQSLATLVGDWVFGCDICQEVCPHNRKAPTEVCADYEPRDYAPTFDLRALLDWTAEDYAATLAGSAIKRASLEMLKRNASIALANDDRNKR